MAVVPGGLYDRSADERWMAAALAISERGRGRTAPNPAVGCVIVRPAATAAGARVVGRGWTQPGGRPHAEAMALATAGTAARGATVYTTLEPCAHASPRGPACSDLLAAAGVARVVTAIGDPDPRTDGRGHDRLRAASVAVDVGVLAADTAWSMAGFLTRRALGRPFVTLKLATSLDGAIATGGGESKWITGAPARAHAHLERARHEAILVGRGTYEADSPKLDVRLAGLADRAPRRILLTSHAGVVPASTGPQVVMPGEKRTQGSGRGDGWESIGSPEQIADLADVDHLLVEGGARAAAAFLLADLVDRLLLYRAPILIGGGRPAIGGIGLQRLADAHGRWRLRDRRMLGIDAVEEYERVRG